MRQPPPVSDTVALHGIAHVLGVGASLQMRGIAARRVIARVPHTDRPIALRQKERDA